MLQEVTEQVHKISREAAENIHAALPAKVLSVDTAAARVTVQPYGKIKASDTEMMDYPIIPAVPLYFPVCAGFEAAFPVSAGDDCLLIFCDTELDAWLQRQTAGMSLKHALTNAIALPGLSRVQGEAFAQAVAAKAFVVKAGATALAVTASGITVTGNLTVSGTLTAGGALTAGGGVSVTGSVSVSGGVHASGSVTGSNID